MIKIKLEKLVGLFQKTHTQLTHTHTNRHTQSEASEFCKFG